MLNKFLIGLKLGKSYTFTEGDSSVFSGRFHLLSRGAEQRTDQRFSLMLVSGKGALQALQQLTFHRSEAHLFLGRDLALPD